MCELNNAALNALQVLLTVLCYYFRKRSEINKKSIFGNLRLQKFLNESGETS